MLGCGGSVGEVRGVVVVIWRGIRMMTLLAAIIAFAFVSGIVEIVSAFQVRDVWLGLSGIISVLFGIYAFRFPGDGALAILAGIGIYAVAVGVMLVMARFQVRQLGNTVSPSVA